MRLLILSHTPHYRQAGGVVGWGPTVREIDHLAKLFEEVVHLAPMHPDAPPESSLPYTAVNVRYRSVQPSGGRSFQAKLGAVGQLPAYAHAFLEELRNADVAHIRCPANLGLLGIVLLMLVKAPKARWVRYAGNWSPSKREALSYRFQRWWLRRRLHRGVVTVNGRWKGQPPHVHSFYNPSLTDEELARGREVANEKVLGEPVRLLFVGALEETKGAGRGIEILARLHAQGVPATLDLVGDSPSRDQFEELSRQLGVSDQVTFHGWLPRFALDSIYARSHLILLPSGSEGWPKVLSEAMAYGVVPLAAAVSSIPQYLEEFGTGRTFAPQDVDGFAVAARHYVACPDLWRAESRKALAAASHFTYVQYLIAVRNLLADAAPDLRRRDAVNTLGYEG